MKVEIFENLESISADQWQELNQENDPFLNYHFYKALEDSNLLTKESGWMPLYFCTFKEEKLSGVCPVFRKFHSYGEYIFDWQIANAFQSYQVPFYPKLLSMPPFSPVNTLKVITKDEEVERHILDEIILFYKNNDDHSLNFNYINERELQFFKEKGFTTRLSTQYHWTNQNYHSFDDFLNHLKKTKRKNIKKERISIKDQGLIIIPKTGQELSEQDAICMYSFYMRTINKKFSYAYLNVDFFRNIFNSMKDNILFLQAVNSNNECVGVTLNFFNSKKLYGRYWGGESSYKNLHFELCYYSPIDFCIEKNIEIFEAGAQGEHKIPRGFLPKEIHSAHTFKAKPFENAINDFAIKEKESIQAYIKEINLNSPYKTN